MMSTIKRLDPLIDLRSEHGIANLCDWADDIIDHAQDTITQGNGWYLQIRVDHANGMALVIKKFDADPLADILKRERLEVSEALGIALSLTRTIEELHDHNIIHKDIQPENIFVGPHKMQTWIVDVSVSS